MSADKKALAAPSTGWQTPRLILDRVEAFNDGPPGLDPATTAANPTRADHFFTPAVDGLSRPWSGYGLVFLNWPWSRAGNPVWANRIIASVMRAGVELIAVAQQSGGVQWYRDLQGSSTAYVELSGRVCFVDPETGKPTTTKPNFATVIFYFGPRLHRFVRTFGDLGVAIANVDRALMLLTDVEATTQLQLDYVADRLRRDAPANNQSDTSNLPGENDA